MSVRLSWTDAAAECHRRGDAYVLATVLATSGSTPRASGAKMVVTEKEIYDTIGGGQLERLVIEQARALLGEARYGQRIDHLPLGAAADQCCGGSVTILLEVFAPAALTVAVFGAGHVGQEIVELLARADARTLWFDARPEYVDRFGSRCALIENVDESIKSLPDGTEPVIVTHDHALDFDLVAALLNAEFESVGLIGSATKWDRFKTRLARDGFDPAVIERVRCPIGIEGIDRKEPFPVALSIVADLLTRVPAPASAQLTWQQVRSALVQVAE